MAALVDLRRDRMDVPVGLDDLVCPSAHVVLFA